MYRPFKCARLVKVVTAGILNTRNSSLEGATKLKFVPFCSSCDALSGGILFSKLFSDSHGFRPENEHFDFGGK